MAVTINLAAYLRQYTGNKENIPVKGKTIKACLDDLTGLYPKLKGQIFDKKGKIHNYVSIFAAGEIIYPDKLETPVKEDTVIHILYIIGGG